MGNKLAYSDVHFPIFSFYSFMRVELTPRNALLTPVCLLLFWSENKGVNIQ